MKEVFLGIIILILAFMIVVKSDLLEKREITIDTLKVGIANNRMSNIDAKRVFNYAKSSLYDYKKYEKAEKAFKAIIDYSESELRDDSLYYIGRIYYHQKKNAKYVKIFQKIYNSFPEGDVVRSGLLNKTLLNILREESVEETFHELMQVYHLLTEVAPSESHKAKQIVQRRISESFIMLSRREEFNIPCTDIQTREYNIHNLASKHGWRFTNRQIMDDINNDGDLTKEWKEGEIKKLKRLVYQRAADRSVEHFEYTTKMSLNSRMYDKIRYLIEKNSKFEHSVITKIKVIKEVRDIRNIDGHASHRAVISCCIFYEISLDTIAKLANIDLFDIGRPTR